MNYDVQLMFLDMKNISKKRYEQCRQILMSLQEQENAMSEEEIIAYAKKIKPVLRGFDRLIGFGSSFADGDLYWVGYFKLLHNYRYSYNGHPFAKAEGLEEIGRIKTYHQYHDFQSYVKEVLWQCPKEILDKACAFEIVVPGYEVEEQYDKDVGLFCYTTVFYEGKIPSALANEEIRW